MCPTNNDPNFDGRPRVKRTTGIPRSFLKTIEKPTALTNDGTVDDTKQPSGVMVNAEGEFVIAEPDKASWEQYQAKAKVSAAAQQAAVTGSEELREKGLECSIDKRMFNEPTRTPCCGRTYCNDCIINALVENDLVCPGCSTEGVLIDNLLPDDETAAKIKAFEEEKAGTRTSKDNSGSPVVKQPVLSAIKSEDTRSGSSSSLNGTLTSTASPGTAPSTKKRPAEEELYSQRTPDAPRAARNNALKGQQKLQQPMPTNGFSSQQMGNFQSLVPDIMLPHQASLMGGNFINSQGMNPVAYGVGNGYMGMTANMASVVGPNNGMMGNMMQSNGYIGNNTNSWNNMGGPGFFQPLNSMYGADYSNGTMANGGYAPGNMQFPMGSVSTGMGSMGVSSVQQQQMLPSVQNHGTFLNQQRTVFSEPFPNEEDNAYFRKPVNPHRHQARQRRVRPSDYREL